jgi:hypothetical protein
MPGAEEEPGFEDEPGCETKPGFEDEPGVEGDPIAESRLRLRGTEEAPDSRAGPEDSKMKLEGSSPLPFSSSPAARTGSLSR